jgi:hypothetical protein
MRFHSLEEVFIRQLFGCSWCLRFLKITNRPNPITRPIAIDSTGNPGIPGDGVVDEVADEVVGLVEVPVKVIVFS